MKTIGISTRRGTLDLASCVDPQYVDQLLAMGSWCTSNGYVVKRINKKRISLHRTVWELANGPIPAGLFIDHIDRVRHNCKLENLRLVTAQENRRNTDARGYYWHKGESKWMAYIGINSRVKYLGYFDTEAEARARYLEAKVEYHPIAQH